MTPYFDRDGVTLYHGDCLEILPTLGGIDAVVTDPPYGVGLGVAKDMRANGHGLAKSAYASYEDTYENFVACIAPRLNAAIDRAPRAAVFTGPHIHEQRKPDAIGGVYCPSASGRHCWGFKTFLPVLLYGKAPDLHKGAKPNTIQSTAMAKKNGHPCPKPVEWMRWLVRLTARPGETVLDPFAGSGTTAVACIAEGRKFIGIELDERYCEIAAKRIEAELARTALFACPDPSHDA